MVNQTDQIVKYLYRSSGFSSDQMLDFIYHKNSQIFSGCSVCHTSQKIIQ